MANQLVPIPWQPSLFLTPSTLARLTDASNRLGRRINVRAPDGAWRPYVVQKKYYDAYLAYLAGRGPHANPASNPDIGQRGHLRGASFDALNTDAATQAACRAAGLTRDAVEAWHWNDPNLYNMPVIVSNTGTAGSGNSTPIPAAPEPAPVVIQRVGKPVKYFRCDPTPNQVTNKYDGKIVALPEGGVPYFFASVDEYEKHVNTTGVYNDVMPVQYRAVQPNSIAGLTDAERGRKLVGLSFDRFALEVKISTGYVLPV